MKRRWLRGFTLVEMLAVTAIISSLSGSGGYTAVLDKARETACMVQLKQVYDALVMFDQDNGGLPTAVLFPRKEYKNRDPLSLANVLKPYLGGGGVLLCTGAGPELKGYGISYAWNSNLNGQSLEALANPGQVPLLMDANALIGKPAHRDGWNILYADGIVRFTNQKPNWKPQ